MCVCVCVFNLIRELASLRCKQIPAKRRLSVCLLQPHVDLDNSMPRAHLVAYITSKASVCHSCYCPIHRTLINPWACHIIPNAGLGLSLGQVLNRAFTASRQLTYLTARKAELLVHFVIFRSLKRVSPIYKHLVTEWISSTRLDSRVHCRGRFGFSQRLPHLDTEIRGGKFWPWC